MLSAVNTVVLVCGFFAMAQANRKAYSPLAKDLNTTSSYSQDYKGIWYWTWSGWANAPAGANIGVAFNGWADPWKALSDSWGTYDKLPGNKWISLGGGNSNGRFTWNNLNDIKNAINGGSFSAYHGIVFDVEEGDSGLAQAFKDAFQACKNKGIDVMVTVSHSAPYGIGDAYSLMNSFFKDGNIHFLSPQLYTSGEEGGNDFTTTMGVPWSSYGSWNTKAIVIPSIVKADYFWDAAGYLGTQGVDIQGFVQWSQ